MKRPTDEALNALAHQLGDSEFQTTLSAASQTKVSALHEACRAGKLRGVMFQVRSSGNRYAVRQYIGGSMLTLAAAATSDWIKFCRLADMLTLRLGPDRLRNEHIVKESEMNFSIAQAEADLLNEPQISTVLSAIKSHLCGKSFLRKPGEPSVMPTKSRKLEVVLSRLDRIEAKLDKLLSPK